LLWINFVIVANDPANASDQSPKAKNAREQQQCICGLRFRGYLSSLEHSTENGEAPEKAEADWKRPMQKRTPKTLWERWNC
jgi:hypothetical protein